MKNVLIFLGGTAPERDVSVITGVLTANSFDKELFNSIVVFMAGDGKLYVGKDLFNLDFYKTKDLKKCRQATLVVGDDRLFVVKGKKISPYCVADCAINCLHGGDGEGGALSGLLKSCFIPLASPDIYPSALSIDKHFTKLALKTLGVNCVDYVRVKRDGFFARGESVARTIGLRLGYPVIVKPATLGSSIGIRRANDENELFAALCGAFEYDGKAICEKYLSDARDLNCAAYCDGEKIVVSEVEEAVTAHDILTFDDKYGGSKGGGARRLPADIPEENSAEIKETVRKIYSEYDFGGIVRFDFLFADGKVYLNEINSVPGSLAYYLFCDKISDFSEILVKLVSDAEKRRREERGRIHDFPSAVLSGDWKSIKK